VSSLQAQIGRQRALLVEADHRLSGHHEGTIPFLFSFASRSVVDDGCVTECQSLKSFAAAQDSDLRATQTISSELLRELEELQHANVHLVAVRHALRCVTVHRI